MVTRNVSRPLPAIQPIPTDPRFDNLTGKQFNSLAVLGYGGRRGRIAVWICRCQCGTVKPVRRDHLLIAASCGCRKGELNGKAHTIHGACKNDGTDRTYRSWIAMKSRCRNESDPFYPDYGGRGIKVCRRWLRYKNFLADMGKRPKSKTLGRIDNDGDYCPTNCAWQTAKEQGANKRNNRRITFQGETQVVAEWARRLGANRNTLGRQITRFGIEAAFAKYNC